MSDSEQLAALREGIGVMNDKTRPFWEARMIRLRDGERAWLEGIRRAAPYMDHQTRMTFYELITEALIGDEGTPGPPAEDDIQRRCWTLYAHPDGYGQCRLYNGHDGDHDFGLARKNAALASPEGLDAAWREAEAALPEGWLFYQLEQRDHLTGEHRWEASASSREARDIVNPPLHTARLRV